MSALANFSLKRFLAFSSCQHAKYGFLIGWHSNLDRFLNGDMKKKGDNLSKHFFCMSLWILIISGQRRTEVWKKLLTSDIWRFDDFFCFHNIHENTWFWEWGVSIKINSNSTWNYFLPFFRQIEIKMTKIFICEFRKDLASLYDVLSAFCVVACKDKKRDVH